MINIDNVYQKVLALASKEQRGYITPQEYNLFVNKAQNEIFEDYFHNFKTAEMKPKSHLQYADEIELLEHKLHPFRMYKTIDLSTSDQIVGLNEMGENVGDEVYYIDSIRLKTVTNNSSFNTNSHPEIAPMSKGDFLSSQVHPLTKATVNRPTYERIGSNAIKVWPGPVNVSETWGITVDSFRKPRTAKWGYVVVNGKAMYNNNTLYSTDIELHSSEEELIVAKVLQLAGVAILKQELIQMGGGMEGAIKQSKDD